MTINPQPQSKNKTSLKWPLVLPVLAFAVLSQGCAIKPQVSDPNTIYLGPPAELTYTSPEPVAPTEAELNSPTGDEKAGQYVVELKQDNHNLRDQISAIGQWIKEHTNAK